MEGEKTGWIQLHHEFKEPPAKYFNDFNLLFEKLSASVQIPGELHDAQILPVANLPEVWASACESADHVLESLKDNKTKIPKRMAGYCHCTMDQKDEDRNR
ncbi:hypothetical protein DUI87_04663 [Hirundo rustica rustica]|uniref:Uncharacterized protein n=1 Tax=Hirundo rustica rustica TaxID=333673 RepID=A0A3M0LI91_HIRRU|nr:hypothetical protein DUI87_04663 [Hirundo rustica rustica]